MSYVYLWRGILEDDGMSPCSQEGFDCCKTGASDFFARQVDFGETTTETFESDEKFEEFVFPSCRGEGQ